MFGIIKRIGKTVAGTGPAKALRLSGAFAAGLLIGRVRISASVGPFGVAYISAAFLSGGAVNPYAALAGVLLSLITSMYSIENIPFAFGAVALDAVLMIFVSRSRLKKKHLWAAGAAALVYTLCTLFFKRLMILNIIASATELCLAVIMSFLLSVAARLFAGGRRTVLSDLEMISVGFAGVLFVMGLGRLEIAGVYLRDVCSVFISMCAAFLSGAAAGAAVGAACGAAALITGADESFFIIVTAGALISGLFKKLNRYVFALAYLFASLIVRALLNGSVFSASGFFTVFSAAVVFCALPKKFFGFAGRYFSEGAFHFGGRRVVYDRLSEMAVSRLRDISAVYENAAGAINSLESARDEKISYAVADIPEKACSDCVFYARCWDADFESTFSLMQRTYARFLRQRRISERDFGTAFLKRCIYPEKVAAAALATFAEHEKNVRWIKRVAESRSVLKEQLRGVSLALKKLANEVAGKAEPLESEEEDLRYALDDEGVLPREVFCYAAGGAVFASVAVKTADPETERRVKRAVSRAMKRKMSLSKKTGADGGYVLLYEESRAIGLLPGVACVPKEGMSVSGDAHLTKALKDSRYLMMVSDGMGSGENAAKESGAVVSLMEDFYGAGLSDSAVIRSVNKLMLLGGAEDMFSTIDMCMVDLKSARARFTKIGAPHSYVIRGERVKRIEPGALPMGILDEISPAVTDVELKAGDVIIMYSDGVADAETDNAAVFSSLMRSAGRVSPKEIAENMLALAAEARGGKKDDMTVIAARVTAG